MNRGLMIELRGNEIKIYSPPGFPSKGPVADMSLMCEAIILLIHSAHRAGIEKDYISIQKCIKHLEQGLIDDQYKTSLIKH